MTRQERRILRTGVGTPTERCFYILVITCEDEDVLGAVTYERTITGHASVNSHWTSNVTGHMARGDEPCEFMCTGEPCWFDGTSTAPVQPDEAGIWQLLERWAPLAPEERT